MSLGKTLGVALGIYVLLNFVFALLFIVTGGMVVINDGGEEEIVSIGAFFADYVSEDYIGFIALLFAPGGGISIDPLYSIMVYVNDLTLKGDDKQYTMAAAIIGILWTILPGIIAGVVAGSKFAEDNTKHAFFGVVLAILICTCIPMILSVVGQLEPWPINNTHQLTFYLVSPEYWPMVADGTELIIEWKTVYYVNVILTGFLAACLYGGFSAMAAGSNG